MARPRGYREVDLCCGSIADKSKLIIEFERMEIENEKLIAEVARLEAHNKVLCNRATPQPCMAKGDNGGT